MNRCGGAADVFQGGSGRLWNWESGPVPIGIGETRFPPETVVDTAAHWA